MEIAPKAVNPFREFLADTVRKTPKSYAPYI
jgi:hypothetical protein